MSLTVVILTKNEARHIVRAIESVRGISSRIVVVDSGSSDETVALAKSAGADILTHPFVTQAKQFNWTLDQLRRDTDWVLRLDADEIVSSDLANEIAARLDTLSDTVAAVSLKRRIAFLGHSIRWGGVFPIHIVRLFRFGQAKSEDRWMDEHIVTDGRIIDDFAGEILDDNLNSLSWWIDKHNAYASREAIELLDEEFGFLARPAGRGSLGSGHTSTRRWFKMAIYQNMPGGVRAFVYFVYRYVLRLGFLDGREGTAFHVLQGFWYRYLVDMKLHEVRQHIAQSGTDPVVAIRDRLGVDLAPFINGGGIDKSEQGSENSPDSR
jgi:glycosyltransferase involved in cell wall biosynthesis